MTPQNKEAWEKDVTQEISFLLAEYAASEDDSRIVNVLEKIDELLTSQKASLIEATIKIIDSTSIPARQGTGTAIQEIKDKLRSLLSTGKE